jgi:hypothetical protein
MYKTEIDDEERAERSVWRFGEQSYAGYFCLAGGVQLEAGVVYILYNDDNAAPFLASTARAPVISGFSARL